MEIEHYIRIDGWLNVRVNPIDNQSLYDFEEYDYNLNVKHTLSEAHELYNEYLKKKASDG
jgi:hypothetical protein